MYSPTRVTLKRVNLLIVVVTVFYILIFSFLPTNAETSKSGSIGLEGTIPGGVPTQAASITFPTNGATINNLPITVMGICPKGTVVKLYKNNVFTGSAQCSNGSFSIQTDLFTGSNELVARVYNELDQAGPDSNIVTVNYPLSQFGVVNRVSLTSTFAKRGANPGELLSWPITLSGGIGPYAISVDWGDGTKQDLISQQFPGALNISHKYEKSGTYVVIVRASDKNGEIAFLQLIGVAKGPVTQDDGKKDGAGTTTIVKTRILWLPALIALPLILVAFWLGRKHELDTIHKRLDRGDSDF